MSGKLVTKLVYDPLKYPSSKISERNLILAQLKRIGCSANDYSDKCDVKVLVMLNRKMVFVVFQPFLFSLAHPFFLSRGMICPLTILRLFSRCGQSEQSHFYENFYLKFPSKIHKNTNKIPEKTTHRSKCLKNSKALRKMII